MITVTINVFFRCNGIKTSPSLDQINVNTKTILHTTYNHKQKLVNKDTYNNEELRDGRFFMGPETISNPFLHNSNISYEYIDTKVKIEPEELIFDNISGYSIIGKIFHSIFCFIYTVTRYKQ